MKFCICAEFLDAKLSENSSFDTPVGVPTKARVLSKICNFGNYMVSHSAFEYILVFAMFSRIYAAKKKRTESFGIKFGCNF